MHDGISSGYEDKKYAFQLITLCSNRHTVPDSKRTSPSLSSLYLLGSLLCLKNTATAQALGNNQPNWKSQRRLGI